MRHEVSPIRLYLLGTFRATVGDPPQEVSIGSLNARRLLAYLALTMPQPAARSHVAGVLFSEFPEERARRALNQAIWRVRKSLGQDAIEGDYNTVALGTHVWADVAAFRRQAAQTDPPDLEQAVALYGGDFWPEGYEDWVLVARERLRDRYLSLLDTLIQAYKQAGRYEDALRHAREYARVEPLQESIHREIIHLYLILERPTEALQQYKTLRTLLHEELGVSPSPELEVLYHLIQERMHQPRPSEFAPVLATDRRIPFVGRHRERAQILEAVEQAYRGQGAIVFVEGMPGMGKSRLMEEVREGARWRGLSVGYGQATPMASPYSPLREAVEEVLTPACVATLQRRLPALLRASAAHVWPTLGTPAPETRSRQLRNALVQVVLALASCAPLVLILDDVHNADAEVLDILADLAPHLVGTPLLVVVTYRPLELQIRADAWEKLLTVDRHAAPLRIALADLTPDEQRLFIGAALSVPPDDPVVHVLTQAAGGIPLHIVEMLRYLHRRGILRRSAEGKWELTRTHLPVPPSVPTLIQQRVRRLATTLRQALEMLAVFGERVPQSLLAEMLAGYPPSVLQELVRHGFLVAEEDAYAFSHALVREAVYDGMVPERRRAWHKRIADLLRAHPVPMWDQMAVHLAKGDMPEAAVHAHLQAAREAFEVYANERALEHCNAALALMDRPDPLICDLWLLRGQVLTLLGRHQEARQSLARALYLARCLRDADRLAKGCLLAGREGIRDGNTPMARRFLRRAYRYYAAVQHVEGVVESLLALTEVEESSGNLVDARSYIWEAMQLAQAHDLSLLYMRTLSRGGLIEARLGHKAEAERLYTQGAQLAEEHGDLYVLGACLNGLGLLAMENREHARASRVFLQVLEIARQIGDAHNEAVTLLNIASAAGNAGYLGTAYEKAQEALAKARTAGNRSSEVLALLLLGSMCTYFGRFDQAEQYLEESLNLAQRYEFRAATGYSYRNLGIWAREQGHLEEAIAWGEKSVQFFAQHNLWEKIARAAYQLGHTLLVAQDFRRAEEVLSLGLERLPDASPESPMAAFLRVALGCAQVCGGRAAGRELVEMGRRVLTRLEADEYLPMAWYQVYLAAQRWDSDEAQEALRRAYMALRAACVNVPAAHQHAFMHQVLSHRLIAQAWLNLAPRPIERMRVWLPSLNGKGQVAVIWTVDAGDEDALIEAQYGPVALRRHRLKRLLQEAEAQGARATHKALADVLHVSVPTIRRDLQALG